MVKLSWAKDLFFLKLCLEVKDSYEELKLVDWSYSKRFILGKMKIRDD